MSVLLIPLDDRPVTYVYPCLVANTAGVDVVVPPRSLMGSLFHAAQIDSLFGWINNAIQKTQPEVLIVGLDSLLYGGLITSRRCEDNIAAISKRLGQIKKWKQKSKNNLKIYAQTSIMRISDNYDNTEEKQYWARYGREIFAWSTVMYRMLKGSAVDQGILESYENRIPEEIRTDYLDTRFRNFQINNEILGLVEEGIIDQLIMSVDDSGQLGLNVLEKEKLIARAKDSKIEDRVKCYPGADEVLSALFAMWTTNRLKESGCEVRAKVLFSPESSANCSSRYEGQTIGETIKANTEALNIKQVQEFSSSQNPNDIDLTVIVHSGDIQGDHILLPGSPDLRQLETSSQVEETLSYLEKATTPCVLCDVAYANGADPILIEELLARKDLVSKLVAYAGWNTTGNSVGSALALGIARMHSVRTNRRNQLTDRAFQKTLFTRLADDWAYQAQIRSQLDAEASIDKLAQLISPYLGRIGQSMGFEPGNLRVSFPWKRTFELEVCFEDR